MPIVFLFSAIASGISLVLLLYYFSTLVRKRELNMPCLNKLGSFLFYALLLDFIHRAYESEESIEILSQLVFSKLFISLTIVQILIGTIAPLVLLAMGRYGRFPDELRRLSYFIAAILVQIGIFGTRWNVVIGGQLFSKSFRGLTVYKAEMGGIEGVGVAIVLLVAPFAVLYVLTKILPPWDDAKPEVKADWETGRPLSP